MWEALREFVTSDGGQWHEKLPIAVGLLFVAIEIVVRTVRQRKPVLDIPALTFMFSEGIAVTIVPIYGLALAFNKSLASAIAEKNGKVLAAAMLMAFVVLIVHVRDRWFSKSSDHD